MIFPKRWRNFHHQVVERQFQVVERRFGLFRLNLTIQYNTEKANTQNTAKLPWFSHLLRHLVRERGGLIVQRCRGHTVCQLSLLAERWAALVDWLSTAYIIIVNVTNVSQETSHHNCQCVWHSATEDSHRCEQLDPPTLTQSLSPSSCTAHTTPTTTHTNHCSWLITIYLFIIREVVLNRN